MEHAGEIEFHDGDILIREGEDEGIILVILEGTVRVVRLQQDEREKDIAEPLRPEDTVGEMSFIDGIGASATLIAVDDVKTQAVYRSLVDNMAAKDPSFRERLYHSLLLTVIRRLRAVDHLIAFPG